MITLNTEEKIFIYSWLKNILSHELTEQQLQQYQQGVFTPLFDFLSEQDLAKQINTVRNSLMQLSNLPLAHLELAADFAQLFLLNGENSALPYASAYLSEKELNQHIAFINHLLFKYQLKFDHNLREPSDHLAVYLELLITLEKSGQKEKSFNFIQHYLLAWLIPFNKKVQKIKTETSFYQAITEILITLLNKNVKLS
ncbi:molecular chaperone TorD [Histophilus somni]|uniref:molecular chaperone TorD n=1 Tax=Histophilus somni TaxID=731 RepID=UPI00201F32F3|nr:molecular chaperone TorD [Histophilus somni]